MAMAGKTDKLKASSLVEVLVAMTILLIILAAAGIAYVRFAAQRPDRQLRVEQQLARIAAATKVERDFDDDTIELAEWGIRVVKQCQAYEGHPDIMYLSLTAYAPPERLVAEYRELIYMADDEEE